MIELRELKVDQYVLMYFRGATECMVISKVDAVSSEYIEFSDVYADHEDDMDDGWFVYYRDVGPKYQIDILYVSDSAKSLIPKFKNLKNAHPEYFI